ncbi:type IV secretory system conjugative DNA transfer family protein [Ruegeria arenilitoris]|uniref:type IV secretory system conjugative DNA transfer family protein n=1 Tax=Ruegeria arenilitoris TaxID=1173585 RepID=UPI00147A1AB8|nr:type IV secretory system conjugative DNA transfer family protein [Ruegeria arenilitoris]
MYDQSHGPYGSARFATLEEVRAQGLLRPSGVEFGFVGGRPLYHANRAGMKVTGSSGSGKSSQIAIPMILGSDANFFILDVKNGEISRVIEAHCALLGIPFYTVDPYGVTDLPNLRVSLLSHLKAGSASLVPDSQRFWMAIQPDSGGDGSFFDQAGRRFGDALTRHDVNLTGGTSLMSIFNLVSMIRADFEAWKSWADLAFGNGPPDIAATFAEMANMYSGSPKTFDSILAGMSNALAFMTDPNLQDTFASNEAADFSLDVIAQSRGRVIVSFIIPDKLLGVLSPLVRQFISSVRLAKEARPDARPVYFQLDEAARLKRFEELAEMFAIGRSAGTVPIVYYQDDGQIARNLGPTGKRTIEANAAMMLDLGGGIRDFETAKARSEALGYQTIAVNDPLTQARGHAAAAELKRQVMFEGGDPYVAGLKLSQLEYEAGHKRLMRKALMEPEQLMGLDASKMLVQARSYHLRPFIAEKRPYFLQRRFAGHYLPNPDEGGDAHSVMVRTFWGMHRRKIIETDAPPHLRELPQYRSGRPLRYVEGYKPKP